MPTESLPLRDIHLPMPIGIWPLATGWWFLFAAILMAIAVILYLIQRHRRPTALKQALSEVERLLGASELSHFQRNQKIALILKQLAVTSYPREDVAGLSGQEWIEWIRSQLEDRILSSQLLEFLKIGPYSSNENVIQDQSAFRTEMNDLLIAVGRPKESLISKWRGPFSLLKSKRAK